MASCYRCGNVLVGAEPRQRRKVFTGESFWVLRAKRRQSSQRTNYGMRIVCRGCAHKLDWGRGVYRSAADRAKWFLTMLVLLVLFIAAVLKVSELVRF